MADEHVGAAWCAAFCACMLPMVLVGIPVGAVLIAANSHVVPVEVTVDDASLAEPTQANGTASVVAYDIVSVAVALSNPNWGASVWLTAPLVAELRFRGHAFARAQLAGGDGSRIPALKTAVYSMAGVAQSAPVALGPDGAAEFARERAAGVFELELVVSGEVQYFFAGWSSIRVTCPLRISPASSARAKAAFASVECT